MVLNILFWPSQGNAMFGRQFPQHQELDPHHRQKDQPLTLLENTAG
jgi:hypothetical protein